MTPSGAKHDKMVFIAALLLLVPAFFLFERKEEVKYAEIEAANATDDEKLACQPAQNSAEQPESPIQQQSILPFSRVSADIQMTPKRIVQPPTSLQKATLFPLDQTHVENARFVEEARALFLPSLFVEFFIFDEKSAKSAAINVQPQFPAGLLAFQRVKQNIMTAAPFSDKEFKNNRQNDEHAYFYAAGTIPAAMHHRSISYGTRSVKSLADPDARSNDQSQDQNISDTSDAGLFPSVMQTPRHNCQGKSFENVDFTGATGPSTPVVGAVPQLRSCAADGFFGRELPAREIAGISFMDQLASGSAQSDAPQTFEQLVKLVTQ